MKIEICDGYILIEATVNNILRGRFLVDTGADATVIIPERATQLELKTIRHHIGGVAGGTQIKVPLSRLDALSVDGHATALDPVVIVDINDDPGPYGKIDGVLGSDYIRHFPMTIDYTKRELIFEDETTLEKRKQEGINLELTLTEGTAPYLPVWLNNKLMGRYKLDTGAGMSHIPCADLNSLGISADSPDVVTREASSLGGTYTVLKTRLDTFSLGPALEISNFEINAYDCQYGFIGSDYLRNYVVTLNYREQYAVFRRALH